jgi:hypothetical protein
MWRVYTSSSSVTRSGPYTGHCLRSHSPNRNERIVLPEQVPINAHLSRSSYIMASAESIRYLWTIRDTSKWFREMLPDSDVVKTTLDHIMATSCELQILIYDYTEPKNADCLQFCDGCKGVTGTTAWSMEKAAPRATELVNALSEEQYKSTLAALQNGWRILLQRAPNRDTNLSSEVCPNPPAGSTAAGCHECHRRIKPLWDRLHRGYAGLKVIDSYHRGRRPLLAGERSPTGSLRSATKGREQCEGGGLNSLITFMREVTLNPTDSAGSTKEVKSDLQTLTELVLDISLDRLDVSTRAQDLMNDPSASSLQIPPRGVPKRQV